MKRARWSFLLLLLLLLPVLSCGEEEPEEGEEGIQFMTEFPHTVTLNAEQALIATTGEVLNATDFINADIVTYKSATVKLATGCPESVAHCQPLHICKLSPASKPTQYDSFADICEDLPDESESGNIPNADAGTAFTIRLNTTAGTGRFYIEDVQGTGASAHGRPHLPLQ